MFPSRPWKQVSLAFQKLLLNSLCILLSDTDSKPKPYAHCVYKGNSIGKCHKEVNMCQYQSETLYWGRNLGKGVCDSL